MKMAPRLFPYAQNYCPTTGLPICPPSVRDLQLGDEEPANGTGRARRRAERGSVSTLTPVRDVSKKWAGYHLRRLRGEGAFGQVWEAEAPDGQLVAFKFV